MRVSSPGTPLRYSAFSHSLTSQLCTDVPMAIPLFSSALLPPSLQQRQPQQAPTKVPNLRASARCAHSSGMLGFLPSIQTAQMCNGSAL